MTSSSNSGVALVKAEYVIPIVKQDMQHEVKIEDLNDPSNAPVASSEAEVNGLKNVAESSVEPPKKKKKKGQNKGRSRTVPKVENAFRVCPALLRNEECRFGENCKFLHDITKYIANKPADLGQECVNFKISGKCRYGIECRYSKQHLSSDFKNITDEKKYEQFCSSKFKDNCLSKEVAFSLRKHQYKFPRSDAYVSKLKSSNSNNADDIVASKTCGTITDEDTFKLTVREKKKVDFSNKLYLAPLTTVGNLPFRRICKRLGADITCGEMAMSTNLLQAHQAEWALVKRHPSEDIFGVQICGGFPDTMTKVTELLNKECNIDFIDINMGCPIDLVYKRGEGSALMGRMNKLRAIVQGMTEVSDVPITIKMRTGIYDNKSIAHKIIPIIKEWGPGCMALHGRSREQRYTRAADWDYINECSKLSSPVPFFGNGDILSFEDVLLRRETTGVNGVMVARGALIKPWIFTEIKQERHWDISSQERFELLKEFTNNGLEHWGSDDKGVESTRRFLLEWLSFLHRYIPVGLLERVPQKINERPPPYVGRDELETLFASKNSADWVKISEMLLGTVPDQFKFLPKHKANAYN